MRPAIRIIIACAAALVVAACSMTTRDATDLLWPDLNDPYVLSTKAWTRSGAVYDGINLSFAAAATLKSAAWREAYAIRHAEVYSQTAEEQAEVLAGQRKAAGEGTEAVLALTAPDGTHTKLPVRSEQWKVFALSGQNKLYPLEIRPMERKIWPQDKLEAFFPYANPWRKFYTVRFPVIEPGPVTLVVAGPAGRVDLIWENFE